MYVNETNNIHIHTYVYNVECMIKLRKKKTSRFQKQFLHCYSLHKHAAVSQKQPKLILILLHVVLVPACHF